MQNRVLSYDYVRTPQPQPPERFRASSLQYLKNYRQNYKEDQDYTVQREVRQRKMTIADNNLTQEDKLWHKTIEQQYKPKENQIEETDEEPKKKMGRPKGSKDRFSRKKKPEVPVKQGFLTEVEKEKLEVSNDQLSDLKSQQSKKEETPNHLHKLKKLKEAPKTHKDQNDYESQFQSQRNSSDTQNKDASLDKTQEKQHSKLVQPKQRMKIERKEKVSSVQQTQEEVQLQALKTLKKKKGRKGKNYQQELQRLTNIVQKKKQKLQHPKNNKKTKRMSTQIQKVTQPPQIDLGQLEKQIEKRLFSQRKAKLSISPRQIHESISSQKPLKHEQRRIMKHKETFQESGKTKTTIQTQLIEQYNQVSSKSKKPKIKQTYQRQRKVVVYEQSQQAEAQNEASDRKTKKKLKKLKHLMLDQELRPDNVQKKKKKHHKQREQKSSKKEKRSLNVSDEV